MARPRLVGLIESASAAALCIVRAPYRSGKSVALQQWAGETARDLHWLHLTRDIATAGQFWLQLHAAFGTIAGNPHAPPPGPGFSDSPVPVLADKLRGSDPFTLILEDFHWVQPTGVEHCLSLLLKRAPSLSLIIAARSALDIERLQITGPVDLHVVCPQELEFTDDEALAFHDGSVLAPISAQLNQQLLGKPVLHRAAGRAVLEPRQPAADFAGDILQKVRAALHPEIIASLDQWMDADRAGFMAATLNLVHFDLPLARLVAPGIDIGPCIRILEEIGFLWSRDHSGTTVYGYHALTRECLETLLATDIAACRGATLAAAADLEFARKAYMPAFRYALDIGDYRLGSSMLVKSGMHMLFQATPGFSDALKSVPHTQIVKYPLLSLALGLVYNADKRTRFKGLEYFALALTSSKLLGKSQPPEERLAVGLARTVALRLTGQFRLAASTSRTSIKDRAELSLADRDELEIFETIALGHWGLSLLVTGDFSAATKALHKAVSAGEAVGSAQAVFFATSLLAYRYALDGDLATAADFAELALSGMPDMPAIELYQQTPVRMALAMVELGRRQPEAADAHLQVVISEASTSEFWGRLRIIEAQIELLRGHTGFASGTLALALARRKELPAPSPLDATGLAIVQSELLLAEGNASGAAAALRRLPAKSSPATVARARLSLSTGRPQEVVELLGGNLRHNTLQQALDASTLLLAARLHLQPAASLRPDMEAVLGTAGELCNQWPLALLPDAERGRLAGAAAEQGISCPKSIEQPVTVIAGSLSMITLTPREASILETLAATGDRSEIARIHFVSLNTIKSQLRTLYKKLGATSRDEALLKAHQEHLLRP